MDIKQMNQKIDSDEFLRSKTFEVYSYKFPNNSIYVGYTSHGLERSHKDHSKYWFSPIYKILKEYPDVYPEVELTVTNVNYKELNRLQRHIFDSNLNMKILNENLYYGY